MKKIGAIILLTVSFSAFSQNAIRKNGFGINQDIQDYNVHILDKQLTSFDSSLSSSFRINYGRFLNRKWEFNIGVSNGFVLNQTQGDQLIKKSFAFGIDADILFKFNNDKFMPQDARVAPYLSFGYNFNYYSAFKKAGLSPSSLGNEYGIGIKIRTGERSAINVQTALVQQLTGDFNTHMQYRLGFAQSIGKRSKEEMQTKPGERDYDQDGVVDIFDQCPTIAGLDSNFGCPEGWVAGMEKEDQDSLIAMLDQLETEIHKLKIIVDSLQMQGPIVKLDYSKPSTSDTSKVEDPKIIEVPIAVTEPKIGNKPKDVVDTSEKPKTETVKPKEEPINNKSIVPAIAEASGSYYDKIYPGEGYYVVAISTMNKEMAEQVAYLLDKDFPIVRILLQESGFYRVGVYATRDKTEAMEVLKYAQNHGIPSGWLALEKR